MAKDSRLDPDEIAVRLKELEGWDEVDGRLRKAFELPSFADAIAFMTRIAFDAEALDHHPDWSNSYRKVTIELTSHDVGGISERDFELAKRIERALPTAEGETILAQPDSTT